DLAAHVPAAGVQGDEADAGLAQPAGQQQLLAQPPAVAVADARVLAADVEDLAGPAADQVERLGLEAVQALDQAALVEAAVEGVEALEQLLAVGEALGGDAQVHVAAGVAADVERGVGGAQPGGAVAEDAADADVGRQAGAGVAGAAVPRQDGAHARLDWRLAVVRRREVVAG